MLDRDGSHAAGLSTGHVAPGSARSWTGIRGSSCAGSCTRTAAGPSIASPTRLPSGRVREYAYPRYFFSNLSADSRALFCEYYDRLGIRWTQSNHRNISVSHRRSVAAMDEFIGPKR